MDKVRITFFGMGCRIAVGKFCSAEWERLYQAANIFAVPLNEALFDSAYFLELDDPKYKTWSDLGNHLKIFGLLDTYQSGVEIRVNGKKQRKIPTGDLRGDNLLFPLYQTTISEPQSFEQGNGNLIIVEKEIGTVANYNFETEDFLIDNLQFCFKSITIRKDLKYGLLTSVNYLGKELVKKKSDTLIKERFALL